METEKMNKFEQARQEVMERLIQEMESTNLLPWEMPWIKTYNRHQNFTTGHKFKGWLNNVLLSMSGFSTPFWAALSTIKKEKMWIQKGQKGTKLLMPILKPIKEEKDGQEIKKTILVGWRTYIVFNVAQLKQDTIPEKYIKVINAEPVKGNFETIQAAEAYLETLKNVPEIKYQYQQAFYRPAEDFIGMPDREVFKYSEGFYSTLFHEIVHSTGHKSRLDRLEDTFSSKEQYSKEELIAEIGSALMLHDCNILIKKEVENAAAYLNSWKRYIKESENALTEALAAADKAVRFLTA